MKRMFRLLAAIIFATIAFFPRTAYAGTVHVDVYMDPFSHGSVSGSGDYYTDTDYVDVDLWWISDGSCYTIDHWEMDGTVQSYQNPVNLRIFRSSGSVTIYACMKVDHDRVYHAPVYPTCISDGTIEYYSCGSCGRKFSDYDMTNEIYDVTWPGGPAWHNLSHIDFQYAECENDGRKEHYWCSYCQRRFWDSSATSEIYGDDWVLPAGGHNWSSWTTVAATCEKDGYYYRWCSECGAEQYEGIPATGHSWDGGKVTTAATHDHAGVRTYTCTSCGASWTETIPKLTYNVYTRCTPSWSCWLEGDGDYEKGASVTISCSPLEEYEFVRWVRTSDGSTVSNSSVYTFSISDDMDVTAVLQKKHVHSWVEVAYKAPTCTEDGNAAYAYCSDCGLIVDSPSAMDVYASVPSIPALGHDWGAGKVTTEPTEEAEGVRTFTCTVCGATRTEAIPKKEKAAPAPTPAPTPTPTPAPTPEPSPKPEPSGSSDLPLPLYIVGGVGLVAVGALVGVLISRRKGE